MLIFFAVLGGFILDAIFGDPLWLPHPVVYMGKVISFYRSKLAENFTENTAWRAYRRRNHRISSCLSAHSCFPARCASSFIKFTGCSDF